MKKKIIILVAICLAIIAIIIISIKYNKKDYDYLLGRWTSVDGTIIKVIKEYKYEQPIYVNENIIEYWLDIKNNSKYILYYNDNADKSRSNFSIEKNIIEKGKYNIDTKQENIIYFSPESYDNGYIWTCKIKNNNELYNCQNHASNFIKK